MDRHSEEDVEHDGENDARGWSSRLRRGLGLFALVLLGLTLLWWIAGRATAGARRLSVHRWDAPSAPAADATPVPATDSFPAPAPESRAAPAADSMPDRATADSTPASAAEGEIRVLAWNVAHGRGDAGPGLLRNFEGGGEEERVARLARMAAVLRRADADVVVLNEADFEASWSGGLNQAEVLARAAGYGTWVEQRNYDVRLPFAVFSFGNAVLTGLPVRGARWLAIPPHSRLEALAAGAKSAAVVELATGIGPLALVPIHLEPRSGKTRRAALPVLDSLRRDEAPPLVLAGDFNASPSGWPRAGATTVVGELLDRGWSSPRARGAPRPGELTYPMPDPAEAIDWILVEPALRVVEARVLDADPQLSDHAPVLAVLRRAEP